MREPKYECQHCGRRSRDDADYCPDCGRDWLVPLDVADD